MRASREYVHIESDPGNVIVVPAWMLDPAECDRMKLGDPQVSLESLSRHRLQKTKICEPDGAAPDAPRRALTGDLQDPGALRIRRRARDRFV
jgi:hypothetical protein